MFPFLVPYLTVSPFVLGPLKIHFFGLMASCAVGFGVGYCWWVAEKEFRDGRTMLDLAPWLLFPGFIVAHLASVLFYYPEKILSNPLYLIDITSGLSSFGGMIGGVFGGLYFMWREKLPIRVWLDIVARGFALSFIFGRAGCSIAHDHPGKPAPADFFLAVDYPARDGLPAGPRYDLGLTEWFFWVFLFLLFHFVLRGKRRPDGFYFGLLLVLYTPYRFMLDFMRVEDKTYFGITFAQMACIAMGLWGLWFLVSGLKSRTMVEYVPFAERHPDIAAAEKAAAARAAQANAQRGKPKV